MEYKVCTMKGFKGLYHVYENGDIYSVRKKRMLKLTLNGYTMYKYLYVCLTGLNRERWRGPAHIVVALHWVGNKPSDKHEVNHKDMIKTNNHYTNLEWVTHQENMVMARHDKYWESGREKGYKASEGSKRKMAEKKFKKVLLFKDGEDKVCQSIAEVVDLLGIYRKKFDRYVGTNKELMGWKMKFL